MKIDLPQCVSVRSPHGLVCVRSTHGRIYFHEPTGSVVHSLDLDLEGFGNPPVAFDVQEWKDYYKYEYISPLGKDGWEHDILDFGYWYVNSEGDIAYEPPANDWRLLVCKLRKEKGKRNEKR